jgi:hypothetical protein
VHPSPRISAIGDFLRLFDPTMIIQHLFSAAGQSCATTMLACHAWPRRNRHGR